MTPVVIIPSKTISNIVPCVNAVRAHEPEADFIVVDDGIDWDAAPHCVLGRAHIVHGEKPFVYAKNINIGIAYARWFNMDEHGFVLLNDDALLESPGGFSLLAREAEAHPEYGIIGVTTNLTGQPLQRRRQHMSGMPLQWPVVGLREVDHIAFVGVYIPRRTLETVGLLDERFVTYGWDDRDYCHRVKLASLKVGVHDGCYVDHGSLRSSFRGDPKTSADIEPGRAIFREKWGTVLV